MLLIFKCFFCLQVFKQSELEQRQIRLKDCPFRDSFQIAFVGFSPFTQQRGGQLGVLCNIIVS